MDYRMTSLIDKFGSYAVAKEIYNDEDSIYYMNNTLERQLLNYRRINNIFEVGDNFCWCDQYQTINGLYDWEFELVHTIIDYDFKSGWLDEVLPLGNIIRHATDDEIKTGKRS